LFLFQNMIDFDIIENCELSDSDFPIVSDSLYGPGHQCGCGSLYDSYLQEELVAIYFHLTRSKSSKKINILREHLEEVLDFIKRNIKTYPEMMNYLKLFYRLIGQTRDLLHGKGEHDLTYMMIWVWYQKYPVLAIFAIHRFVSDFDESRNHIAFGSWRDIKYLCQYLREQGSQTKQLIDYCVSLMNRQFKKDLETWKFSNNPRSREHISNVAKWIPREYKKFDWLYELLVLDWAKTTHPCILASSLDCKNSYFDAVLKCKRLYRKQVSLLNKGLDTPQIKLCDKNRDNINPNNVSVYTMMKQPKLVFDEDLCSQKFKDYFEKKCMDFDLGLELGSEISSLEGIKNHCVLLPLSYLIKEAVGLIRQKCPSDYKSIYLDKQWKILSKTILDRGFENLLPILDMSFTIQMHDSESFYTAIGIALLIAERTSFGKRILVMDHSATWVNLDDDSDALCDSCNSFVSMVEKLYYSTLSNRSTIVNYDKVIDMIIVGLNFSSNKKKNKNKKPDMNIENLRLVFLSDFYNMERGVFERIDNRFLIEYKCSPQFIFWNLGTHKIHDLVVPCPIHQKNTILLSGFSANLIKVLNNGGFDVNDIKDITPYNTICNILNDRRYDIFEFYIEWLMD